MGKAKKQHKEKVAKRNAKILRERVMFQNKMEKLRKLITENAMAQSHKLTEEVEAAIEAVETEHADTKED